MELIGTCACIARLPMDIKKIYVSIIRLIIGGKDTTFYHLPVQLNLYLCKWRGCLWRKVNILIKTPLKGRLTPPSKEREGGDVS